MSANSIRTGKCKRCATQFDYELFPVEGNTDPASKRLFDCPLCTEPLFHVSALSILGIREIGKPILTKEAISANARNLSEGLNARVAAT